MSLPPAPYSGALVAAPFLPSLCSKFSDVTPLFFLPCYYEWASPVAPEVKNPPANAGDIGDTGSIPWLGRPLGYVMAPYSTILPWKTPWAEEAGGLWGHKEPDTTE